MKKGKNAADGKGLFTSIRDSGSTVLSKLLTVRGFISFHSSDFGTASAEERTARARGAGGSGRFYMSVFTCANRIMDMDKKEKTRA